MRVLVTAASKHGATSEIAAMIGSVLSAHGLDVTVQPPEKVDAIGDYQAVILGSGVYAGRWLGPAKTFVERHRDALSHMPVWLFSSGPVGDPPKPDGDPADATALILATNARGHRVFAGRLDPSELNVAEKMVIKVVRAPSGDYRVVHEIQAWAEEIAQELSRPGVAAVHA